jgi:hypothetical protein
MCTPWTQYGDRLGESHPANEAYFVWQEGCAVADYDSVTMENNTFFPKRTFKQRFEAGYNVIGIVTSPCRMGWPAIRERMYLTALNYKTVIWMGPDTDEEISEHFHSIFGAKCVCEGEANIWEACDSPEHILQQRRNIAASRGIYGGNLKDLSLLISPSARRRLNSYCDLASSNTGMRGGCVADLSQNPHHRKRIGPFMMTAARNSLFISLAAKEKDAQAKFDHHMFTPNEIAFSQGWPTIPCESNEAFKDCMPPTLLDLSVRERASGIGNGMHLLTLTAWQLYVSAHCIRKDSLQHFAPSLVLSPRRLSDFDEEDGEL